MERKSFHESATFLSSIVEWEDHYINWRTRIVHSVIPCGLQMHWSLTRCMHRKEIYHSYSCRSLGIGKMHAWNGWVLFSLFLMLADALGMEEMDAQEEFRNFNRYMPHGILSKIDKIKKNVGAPFSYVLILMIDGYQYHCCWYTTAEPLFSLWCTSYGPTWIG